MRALQRAKPRGLLVGIGTYQDKRLPPVRGAIADVEAMRAALVTRGFDEDQITVLEDGAATRDRILRELRRLVRHARDQLSVFFIACHGSHNGHEPSLVPHDGRSGRAADLALSELAISDANLVTIVDAGCGYARDAPSARMVAAETQPATPRDIVPQPAEHGEGETPPVLPDVEGVLLLVPPGSPDGDPPDTRERAGRRLGGLLTHALVSALDNSGDTYRSWAARTALEGGVLAHGDAAALPVLTHHTRLAAAPNGTR